MEGLEERPEDEAVVEEEEHPKPIVGANVSLEMLFGAEEPAPASTSNLISNDPLSNPALFFNTPQPGKRGQSLFFFSFSFFLFFLSVSPRVLAALFPPWSRIEWEGFGTSSLFFSLHSPFPRKLRRSGRRRRCGGIRIAGPTALQQLQRGSECVVGSYEFALCADWRQNEYASGED
jgi:hypothetical protein